MVSKQRGRDSLTASKAEAEAKAWRLEPKGFLGAMVADVGGFNRSIYEQFGGMQN
jgi:hypothetical protein